MFDFPMSLGELLFQRYSMSDLNAFLMLGGVDADRRNDVMNMVHRLSVLPVVEGSVTEDCTLVVLPVLPEGESDFCDGSLEYNLLVQSRVLSGSELILPGNYSVSALLNMNVVSESLFLLGAQQFISVVLLFLYELCSDTSLVRPVGVVSPVGACAFESTLVNWESLDRCKEGVTGQSEYWGRVLWRVYGSPLFT